jgi:hypothetical protein
MQCPYCPNKINWETLENGGPHMCDECIKDMEAEVERMDAELAAYRANAPLLQKLAWKVEGTINRARNALYQSRVTRS